MSRRSACPPVVLGQCSRVLHVPEQGSTSGPGGQTVLSGLLAPCSGQPTRILGPVGGVWCLSGVLHPLHFVLHLPHHLIPLPLALETVVIRERTYRLFDTPFDLVALATHSCSPCVPRGRRACGHHGGLCGAMPHANAAYFAAPIGLLSRLASLARHLLLARRTGSVSSGRS